MRLSRLTYSVTLLLYTSIVTATTIEFSIPQSGVVTLTIYDVLGRQVEIVLNEYRNTGHHKLLWNASDVPSGIYFVRMQSGSFNQVRKVMVVR